MKYISRLILTLILCLSMVAPGYGLTFKPSAAYVAEFITTNPYTGAAADADSLPTATATRNGTDDGTFALTATKIDTGRYKITGTVPAGYAAGDVVQVSVAATVSGISGKAVADSFSVDTRLTSETYTAAAAIPTNPLLTIDARLNNLDAAISTRSTYAGGAVASVTDPVALTSAYDAAKTAATQASVNAIPITPLLTADIRLNYLDAAISSRSTLTALQVDTQLTSTHGASAWGTSMVLPAIQGQAYTAVALQSKEVTIVRGDTPRIVFDLGADYTGWSPKFGAKASAADTAYVIAVKDGAWTAEATGVGYIDLTAAETATAGRLYAELELRNGASRLTAVKFTLKIVEDIID